MTPSQIKALVKAELKSELTRLETKLQIKPAKLKGKMDEGKREKKYDELFKVTDKKIIG